MAYQRYKWCTSFLRSCAYTAPQARREPGTGVAIAIGLIAFDAGI